MTRTPRKPFALLVRVVVAGLVVVVWWYAAKSQDPALSDATADWILVKAVASDLSPFEDVRSLGEELGVPYRSLAETTEPVLAYRTPGGLIMMYPLLLVSWDHAHLALGLVGMLCFLWMLLVQVPRYCQVPIERLLLPLALAAISAAFIESTYWGAVSTIVAVLMVSALTNPGPLRGVSIAAATLLKLYPGLLLIPLLVKRSKELWVALGVSVAATALGTALFGLSLVETGKLILQGSSIWLTTIGNVSLPSLLGGETAPRGLFLASVAVGVLVVAWYSRGRPLAQSLALAIPVSVLVSPVSWASYDVVLIPIAIWLWTRRDYALGRYSGVAWLLFQAVASTISGLGAVPAVRFTIVALRLLLAVAIAIAPARLWAAPSRARELQPTG